MRIVYQWPLGASTLTLERDGVSRVVFIRPNGDGRTQTALEAVLTRSQLESLSRAAAELARETPESGEDHTD